ncbi:MAG: response regulator [Bdellovibrionales bacterium]|nr:response regulator [Bdellovibrionales bacterium]
MSIKIMIVDDDEINSRTLSQRLTKRGFSLTTINSGKDCLEAIQNDPPDLIMLDIVMPEMDGLAVLEAVRSIYSSVDIPIIMVTAKTDVGDLVTSLKNGASDYIQKPVNIDIAEARIHAQLNSVRNHREAIEKKELEALNTMIATYNHEINNPLTIAYGLLRKAKKEQSLEYFDRIAESLQRVAKIVKEIERITSNAEHTDLEVTQKMYKIRGL